MALAKQQGLVEGTAMVAMHSRARVPSSCVHSFPCLQLGPRYPASAVGSPE